MTRSEYTQFCRNLLNENNLQDWSVRLTSDLNKPFLGLTSYKDKCIILNAHHCDLHPSEEVINTIRHEVAHALCPMEGHNSVWADKARALGCLHTESCSHLSFSPEVIDAIRSGADVKVETVEEVIFKPKYTISRLQDKCEFCGKVAKEVRANLITTDDPFKPDEKYIWLECGHLIVKKIPKGTPFQTIVSDDGKTPYPFQVEGARFIESALSINRGAAVFDEMGLGKTVQALSYLKFHPEAFPVLFIVKSGIKFQWFKEILRWIGNDHLAQVINSSNDFIIPNLKCYIASYDIFVHKTRQRAGKTVTSGFDITRFEEIVKTIVLDECQQIKNPDSARTREIRKLARSCKVIALSGTPWKNRGSEFFTILNMLAPMKFPSYQRFLNEWVDYYFDGSYQKQGGISNPKKFKEYISDIAIRREVNDVMKELPEVNRTLHYTELERFEQKEYDREVSEFVAFYNDKVIGGEEDSFDTTGNILARLARMRHITGLAKIPATEELVDEFIEETDRKLTIFVHHKDVGDILYNNLVKKFPDIQILKLTAEQDSLERFKIQEKFAEPTRSILVASTLASGEGINLQSCADAIMHERQWNPQNEDQAAPGRFRRIGSTFKTVNVTFITAAGTVDETLAGIVERKRAQFHNAMNNGSLPEWNQAGIIKELTEGIVDGWNKRNRH